MPDDDGLAATLEGGTEAEAAALAAVELAVEDLSAHAPGEPDVVFKLVERQAGPVGADPPTGFRGLPARHQRHHVPFAAPDPGRNLALVPYVGDRRGRAAGFALDQADALPGASRTFLFDRNRAAYIASFGLSEDDDPALLLRTYQMARQVRRVSRRRSPFVGALRRRLFPISRRIKVANLWYRLAHDSGRRPETESCSRPRPGPAWAATCLRIRDRMVERGLDRQFDFSYSFRVPHTRTSGARCG